MRFIDRFLEANDQILDALERDYQRPAAIANDGRVTRVEYRAEGWLFCLILGATFFLLCVLSSVSGLLRGMSALSLLAALWPLLLVTPAVLALSALLYFTKNGLIISPDEITVKQGVYPFSTKIIRIPMASVRSVRTGYFRFANWDRYVVLETETRTYRAAWGLSEPKSETVAQTIRQYAATAA